ncbi:class I SAM-dependent methyltransferase [Streptomyces sp. NTH33]|uniref:class I SAM-dependent methyltransferase n=1 Tax=Streptomyces sp. NTH33 TaxID=1735453 RepID=UPI000DA8ED56|nr:class I SAM-dependent methyltransferase [Streptomyces sp. NTH33]PZH06933.1 class I SAM-dependent methyltransferase [Streptomyces sp. NTH33]
MLDIERQTLLAWDAYGTHHQARGTEIPEVDRLAWGYWPTAGPGEEVLGDLTGRRVLDLGSGIGKFPAYLAYKGARVDAVEGARAQHERAVARYSGQAGLHLICADAVEYLIGAEPYDVIYSIHGIPYINPHRLLPTVASALKPGGRLVFSALHTTSAGDGPSTSVTARPETLNLAGGDPLTVQMWVLTPTLWEDLLVDHGLLVDRIDILTAPGSDTPLACALIQARRSPAPPTLW